jgi:spore coat protein U-like protein
MFKKIAIASATAALFSVGQSALAGQTSNTMNVTATVNANCVVTTGPGAYSGTYDPVSANAATDLIFTQSIAFKCTKNSATVTVGIDPGLHNSSGRRLADTGSANFLNYELYQPLNVTPGTCAYTQIYNTGPGAGLFIVGSSNFGPGLNPVSVNICGKIPAGQDVPATGAYTDTVTINVNF